MDIVVRPNRGITVDGTDVDFGTTRSPEHEDIRRRLDINMIYDDDGVGGLGEIVTTPSEHPPVVQGLRVEGPTMREAIIGLGSLGYRASLRPYVLPGPGGTITHPSEKLTHISQLVAVYEEWDPYLCPDSVYFDDIGVSLSTDLGTETDERDYGEPVLQAVSIVRPGYYDSPQLKAILPIVKVLIP